jgi:hypothetical protein
MISQQTSDTTKSTVDADTPLTEIQKYIPLHPNLLDSARTGVSQDVNAFLAKPIIIANGSFTTSDTYATFIYTSDGIPQSLLYTQPLWLNKLAGNFAFKGTLHLSLQVNGTRFQQGRYILGWVPSGGGTDPNKFRRMHTASLTLATQCPHVEVDVNCDSEASLIIPYITAQGWAALNSVNGALLATMEVFSLQPMSLLLFRLVLSTLRGLFLLILKMWNIACQPNLKVEPEQRPKFEEKFVPHLKLSKNRKDWDL